MTQTRNKVQDELERKIQHKTGVINLQIEVLDEYRREIMRLNKLLERKDQIIDNLKKIVNEQNGAIHSTKPRR